MPTTITSAGITFNDATSLTSANITLADGAVTNPKLADGAVTAAKLGTTEQTRIAKAWVNFDGTTSPGTIRSSYNVSSVTKNGVGDYTVNFTTAMSDANYSVSCTGSGGAVQSVLICRFTLAQLTAPTTNSIRVASTNGGSANATDDPFYNVQVFGN